MPTNAELEARAIQAETRLATAARDRTQLLAGQNAAVLLGQRLTAAKMRSLAPALDALASQPTALRQAATQLAEARVAVLGAARDEAQRVELLHLMDPIVSIETALDQAAVAATAVDNGWRSIPEEDRLALVAG